MSTENISPKVHLFGKLDKLSNTQLIMVVLPSGEKFKTSLGELKQFIVGDVKEIEEFKLTKEAVLNLFAKDHMFSTGKPLSILANFSIEKYILPGVIYSDGNRTRICQGGKWVTLKIDKDD